MYVFQDRQVQVVHGIDGRNRRGSIIGSGKPTGLLLLESGIHWATAEGLLRLRELDRITCEFDICQRFICVVCKCNFHSRGDALGKTQVVSSHITKVLLSRLKQENSTILHLQWNLSS